MSPSVRLELTRLFFKLGAPDRMTAQRDAADFQTVGTVARIESRTRAASFPRSGRGGRSLNSCHSDQHSAASKTSIRQFPRKIPPSAFSPSPALGAAIIAVSPDVDVSVKKFQGGGALGQRLGNHFGVG